ncbi:hypothetical protein LCGC14_1897870, partial [marine sediment metagenome]
MSKYRKISLVVMAVLVCVCSVSFGTTYYVATDGDDGDNGGINDPFATIEQGMDTATDGDTVIVAEGTYEELVDFGGEAITLTGTDPDDWDVVEATIIDGNASGSVVTFDTSEDANSVLTGFTITDGYGELRSGYYAGAGIICYGSSPTISKCLITGNGVSLSGRDGGGIGCYNSASPTISNCIISDNEAEYGGGISCRASIPVISNCTINNNSAFDGGGLVSNSDLTITNTIFWGNSAEAYGGGLYCYEGDVVITNCTIADNTAAYGGGLGNGSSDPTITNTIFWGNSAVSSGDEVYKSSGSPVYSYCDIKDSGGSSSWDTSLGTDGGGNIDVDPDFVDAANDDYHLDRSSPCIDAGDPSGDYSGQTDIDGDPRVIAGTIDMGADEVLTVHNEDQDLWYASISASITGASTDDTITVYPGTYEELVDFGGKAITLTSSDPDDWDVVEATIIDGNASGSVVTFDTSEDADSVLTGFTITNGYGTLPDYNTTGAGINCEGSSPTITKCLITGNGVNDDYTYGGGITCNQANPTISNCEISDNAAFYGAGISCYYSIPVISNCTIINNTAGYTINGYGGGLYSNYSDVVITNCTISNNTAGGMGYGGGFHCLDSDVVITNCTIADNMAGYFGGWFGYSTDLTMTNTILSGNLGVYLGGGMFSIRGDFFLTNCTIAGNIAMHGSGGGLYRKSYEDDTVITNCTIAGNSASYGGGLYSEDSDPTITNTIIWGNSAVLAGDEIYNDSGEPV